MALIFIHGAVGDSRLYRHQLRHFGARYKTISVDLPGHGHSHAGVKPTLDDFIHAIEDIAAEEHISSYVLIGHSMGGGVCLEACARRLRGLVGVVLVSTSPVLPVSPALIDILERDDMDALAELIVGAVFSRKVDLLVGFAKKGLYEMSRDIIRTDIKICKEMDYSGVLGEIELPVLVIANRGDLVISSDLSSSLAAGIQNARLVLFEHDGHVPFFENPVAFNETVDSFLDDMAGNLSRQD
ncbi:MAG: alpha/beta hydrolase [Spirochaetes bacterium]|nr:alpha/beta hydrolase [Spirochaetota bacterium]